MLRKKKSRKDFVTRTPREDNSGDVVFHLNKQCFTFQTILVHHMEFRSNVNINFKNLLIGWKIGIGGKELQR